MSGVILATALCFAIAGGSDELGLDADLEQQYFNSFRDRKLEQLLEEYCRRQLHRTDLDAKRRAAAVVELSALVIQRGNQTLDAKARRQLWSDADQLSGQFLRDNAQYPRALELRYHSAAQWLGSAQFLTRLAEALPDDADLRQDAKTTARRSVDTLSKLLTDVELALTNSGARPGAGGLSAEELIRLATACRFQLGVSQLALAAADPKSEQSKPALKTAERLLAEFARDYNTVPVTLESHLALAEVYRLQDRQDEAVELLERFENDATPPGFRSRAVLAQARLLLSSNDAQAALTLLESHRSNRASGPEWDLVVLETQLEVSAAMRGSDPDRATQLQQSALETLDAIGEQFGEYWLKRGEKLLVARVPLEAAGANQGLLERLADVLRNDKKLAEATALYDRALSLPGVQSDANRAARIGFSAARAALEAGDFASAAKRFGHVADQFSQSPMAPRASILAARSWAGQFAKSKDSADLDRYRQVLEAHIARFKADGASASEVHWRLGELAERRGEAETAAEHFRLVGTTSEFYPQAVQALAESWHDRIYSDGEGRQSEPVDRQRQIAEAAAQLEPIHQNPPASLAAKDGKQALQVVRYVLGRLWLDVGGAQAEAAIQFLKHELDSSEPGPLQARIWTLLVFTTLDRGDAALSVELVRRPLADKTAALLSALPRFAPQAEELSSAQRAAQVAAIEAAAEILFVDPAALAAKDRFNVNLLLGQAMAAKGDHVSAQRVFRRLQLEPGGSRDARVLASLARSQFANGQYADSLAVWSRLLRGLRSGTTPWFEALHATLLCHEKLGDKPKAKALLDSTLALYPDIDDAKIRAKLAELKERLSQ